MRSVEMKRLAGGVRPTGCSRDAEVARRGVLVAAVAAMLLAGCSFFSKSQPRIYSLDRIPPAAAVANVRGVPIAIGGIELPPGFDRSEIVVRKTGQQLDVRSSELWPAPLGTVVLHTLGFDLASRLPVGMVILPGEAKPPGVTRAVDVVFEDLSAGPESRVVMDARFVIRTSGQPDVARHEQIAVDIPSLDSSNVATGISRALATLADRIVAAM